MKMTYKEYKMQRQKEFNNLPIFFAFSTDQLEKAMNERGLTLKDTDKIYSFGSGGFYLRSDADKIREWVNTPDPIKNLMNDYEFAVSAFYYEMKNHEYSINPYQGEWEVCSCFGDCEYDDCKTYVDYLKEIGYSENVINAYTKAKDKYWNDAIKYDWF